MLVWMVWSGYPTASQHCSQNQSRHPTICQITFYFEPVSHEWWCMIFNDLKSLENFNLLPPKIEGRKIKHKVELNRFMRLYSSIWAIATSYVHLKEAILRHLPAGERTCLRPTAEGVWTQEATLIQPNKAVNFTFIPQPHKSCLQMSWLSNIFGDTQALRYCSFSYLPWSSFWFLQCNY